MKIKQFFKLSFTLFAISVLVLACGSDSEYTEEAVSADAQIYAFKLTARPYSSIDSVNYPIMAKTRFAIDQFRYLIYNPDSLPYQTELKKFLATMGLPSVGVGKVELVYPRDSVVEMTDLTDSIDFSTPLYPRIRLTAPNGMSVNTYTVDIRVHKINPEKLNWENVTGTYPQPVSVGQQKTIIKGSDTFYTFSIDDVGGTDKLYLHIAEGGENYTSQPIEGIDASDIILESITLMNGAFYAVDKNRKGYSSEDGIDWTEESDDIFNIVGVMPIGEGEDILLVIKENGGQYSFARTSDMKTFVDEGSVDQDFSVTGFSAVTNSDKNNANRNVLAVTGGKKANGVWTNLTWLAQASKSSNGNITLRFSINQINNVFAEGEGLASFMYDDHLYALISNKLYKSASFGYKWISVSDLEKLPSSAPLATGQSVIVDDKNYVWIFGGITENPVHEVWRGRLNRLIPKK
ncbi:MAG: DUF6242 domain-containing protein [Prevotella sp.]|jgi:hypothetical protein|nr:DUF6242 domain-containing protein [Prevotella sp.]